jgi:hypothetical protein
MNKGTCIKTTGVTQSCSINQTSATTDNQAIVVENVPKSTGLTQTASATAQITQTASGASNKNIACVSQIVAVDGSTVAPKGTPVTVTLNATQAVSITQNSASGGNTVQNATLSGPSANCAGGALTQTQTLSSTATGSGPITQNENAGATTPNVSLDIEQNQGTGFFGSASGANAAPFSQTSTLTALASTPAGPVNQTQSSTAGGILAKVNQFSHDPSTANAQQQETQCERAQALGTPSCTTSNKPTYELHQVQFGPISNSGGSRGAKSRKLAYVKKGICPPDCSTQGDNSADSFSINQSSTQTNDTHTDQTNTVQGECVTSGGCTATQTTNENGTTTTHTASGSSVDTSTDCTGGSCTTTTSKGFVSGDLFVSVGNGLVQERSPSGALVRTLDTGMGGYTTGLAFDAGPRLYVTDFGADAVTRFLSDGTASSFGSGYNAAPESIVFDSSGNAYVGQAAGSKQVLKFSPSGTLVDSFSPAPEVVGTDWIELAPDQCTLYYTSEGPSVKRFDVCTKTQLLDFASGLHHGFEIRLLPGGGALVADFDRIVRLDASGTVVQSYGTGGTLWFSLALDPSGTSFWAGDADTGDVKQFDITSGNVLASFNTGSTVPEGAADGIAIAP